jgi:hypothetical protein
MLAKRYSYFLLLSLVIWIVGAGCQHVPTPWGDNKSTDPTTRYVFNDILIPSELSVDESDSFVFETAGFKAGTLFLSGYVDIKSVESFFTENMPKDGWHLKSVFRFPKTVLLFEKPEKACIIELYEKTLSTGVEIWVAPAI